MRAIRPISEIGNRVQEAGKIRLGVKGPKGQPQAISTFRFTSPHRDVMDQLAGHYGGTVKPWSDPKASVQGQFELITEAKTIRVLVPPGGLTLDYELWAGSGRTRQCDGITAKVPTRSPDGELAEVPCICTEQQQMDCKPQTRLTLVLPDVTFRGTWTLGSKSWNAAEELVGMERMIDQIQQDVAIVQAELHLEQRSRMTSQGKRNFVVPTLTIPHTVSELAAGTAGALGATTSKVDQARVALNAGAAALPDSTDHDDYVHVPDEDDVAEAELIYTAEDVAERAADLANELILDPHGLLVGVCRGITRRSRPDEDPVDTPEELTEPELARAMEFLNDVAADRIEVTTISDGNLTIKRKA